MKQMLCSATLTKKKRKENNNTKGLPLVGSYHHCLKQMFATSHIDQVNQPNIS
jgi:hypothetical protein